MAEHGYPSSTIRFSEEIRETVQTQARLERLSTNALIVKALDEYMQRRMSAPFEEIDPAFMAYLRREKKKP